MKNKLHYTDSYICDKIFYSSPPYHYQCVNTVTDSLIYTLLMNFILTRCVDPWHKQVGQDWELGDDTKMLHCGKTSLQLALYAAVPAWYAIKIFPSLSAIMDTSI